MATIIRKSATKMSFQDWEIFARALGSGPIKRIPSAVVL